MRRIRRCLLLTLVLLAAGCSGDSGSNQALVDTEESTEPEDFAAWRTAQAAVCAEFEPRMQARMQQFGQPSSLQEAATYFDRMTPLNDRYISAIVAVPMPDHRRAAVRQLYDLAERSGSTADVARAAAHFSDEPSFTEAVGTLDVLVVEANQLLTDLDLPGCVSQEQAGSA